MATSLRETAVMFRNGRLNVGVFRNMIIYGAHLGSPILDPQLLGIYFMLLRQIALADWGIPEQNVFDSFRALR